MSGGRLLPAHAETTAVSNLDERDLGRLALALARLLASALAATADDEDGAAPGTTGAAETEGDGNDSAPRFYG